MKCPQRGTRMQSERSATPVTHWNRTMLETRHYRCEECDAEYVLAGKQLQKIDGGNTALDVKDLALVTDEIEENECQST